MGNQNGGNKELFARVSKRFTWPDVELNLFASVFK